MNKETDYKQLLADLRNHLSLEWDYGKLTAVEKLTVLLSGAAFVVVLIVIGAMMLFYLTSTLVAALERLLGSAWGANLIVVAILGCLMAAVVAFKRQLIIDPIARFVSRLFLTPDDNDK